VTPQQHARLRAIVDEHIRFVARTLHKAGVPPSELDDTIQRTFIAVASRLDDVLPGAERTFVFQVAINMASHARRNLARRREVYTDELPERIHVSATPENLTERKQLRELLDDIVNDMDEPSRAVFTLYELEGLNTGEIAEYLGIPAGTVASRLRRARAHFRRHVVAIDLACDLGTKGANRIDGPTLLRRKQASPLGRALLDAGASTPRPATTRARTLAALGVQVAARQ
jgi:RNA polymerase sigma-70 factor, ECF subfamily